MYFGFGRAEAKEAESDAILRLFESVGLLVGEGRESWRQALWRLEVVKVKYRDEATKAASAGTYRQFRDMASRVSSERIARFSTKEWTMKLFDGRVFSPF